jgi:hypothetical protein
MDWDGLKGRLKLNAEQATAFDAAIAQMRQKMQAQRQARQGGDGAGAPPGDAAGGRGENGGGRGGGDRGKFGQAMREALAPFRATLDDAQKAALDAELASLGAGKRGTVYVLRDGAPVAVAIRIGAMR